VKLRVFAPLAAAVALSVLSGCDRGPREPVSSSQSQSAAARDNAQTAGQAISDAGVTGNVKAALLVDKGVDGKRIHVETDRGNVVLTGKVPDQGQVSRATQIARGIEGVRTVDNQLTSEH
jgi:hyperosmotically inducible periplasmic protein